MSAFGRKFGVLAVASLLLAGGATAAVVAVHTVTLKAGHCRTVSKTLRVCAAAGAAAKTVTQVSTVAPSPAGMTFSGDGDTPLDPFTLTHGANLGWTAQAGAAGGNAFVIDSGADDPDFVCDNGDGAASGTCYIGPGTYTGMTVTADGAWTISF